MTDDGWLCSIAKLPRGTVEGFYRKTQNGSREKKLQTFDTLIGPGSGASDLHRT